MPSSNRFNFVGTESNDEAVFPEFFLPFWTSAPFPASVSFFAWMPGGSDYLSLPFHRGYVNGGAGLDTLDLRPSSLGLTIDLRLQSEFSRAGYANGGNLKAEQAHLRFDDFEFVIASNYDDSVFGSTSSRLPPRDIHLASGNDFFFAGHHNEKVTGSEGNDVLLGLAGNDLLSGHAGQDIIHGGTGIDRLFGSAVRDKKFGGFDRDIIFGESGDDYLSSQLGDDYLTGGEGSDQTLGGEGNDKLLEQVGRDSIYGGSGDNVI